MRKELFTGMILLLMAVTIRAQETKDKKDWTFAAGITAYSSNSYAKGWHPWEINLRYKIKGHHVIRAGVAFKKKSGEAMYDDYPGVDYVAENFPKYPGFAIMVGNKSKKLHGFSIGYDYDYKLYNQLSIFGGLESNFVISKEIDEYYGISSYGFYLDERAFFYNQFNKNNKTDYYNIKPIIGIRYNYKCLAGEFSLGPNIQFSKQTIHEDRDLWTTNLEQQYRNKQNLSDINRSTKVYFHYNLSIYLTF